MVDILIIAALYMHFDWYHMLTYAVIDSQYRDNVAMLLPYTTHLTQNNPNEYYFIHTESKWLNRLHLYVCRYVCIARNIVIMCALSRKYPLTYSNSEA